MIGSLSQAAAFAAFIPGFACVVRTETDETLTFGDPGDITETSVAITKASVLRKVAGAVRIGGAHTSIVGVDVVAPDNVRAVINGCVYATESGYVMVVPTTRSVATSVIPESVSIGGGSEAISMNVSTVYDADLGVSVTFARWSDPLFRSEDIGDQVMIEMASRLMSESLQSDMD